MNATQTKWELASEIAESYLPGFYWALRQDRPDERTIIKVGNYRDTFGPYFLSFETYAISCYRWRILGRVAESEGAE